MSRSVELPPRPRVFLNTPPHMIPDITLGNPRWWPTAWAFLGQAQTNQPGVANRVFLTHIWVPRRMVVSALAMRAGVGGGGGTNLRMGLYADNGQTPAGGALLVDSGNVSAPVAAVKQAALATPVVLQKGLAWFALETQDAVIQYVRHTPTDYFTDAAGENLEGCHYNLGGFGALTDPCPAVIANDNARVMGFLLVDSIE